MEIVKINDLDFVPGIDPVSVRPKQVAKSIHLKITSLPPPVMINLREDADPKKESSARELLTASELDYFKRNGNNATVFIHGFNVPYGEFVGRIQKTETRRNHGQMARHRPVKVVVQTFGSCSVFRDYDTAVKPFPELTDPKHQDLPEVVKFKEEFNGTGAHNWLIQMEYELNRAAGFDGKDYSKYTRIIQVAWEGDVFALDYIRAEANATVAGRRLVQLLKQLLDAGIGVNVIAHSLGNRVLLTALNILGEEGHHNAIKHTFMWQPAVPDTALSNNPNQDTSVLRNWNFIHAHKAAEKIIILHSEQDNVLGGYTASSHREEDHTPGADDMKDLAEYYGGVAGGVYTVATQVGIPGTQALFSPWGKVELAARWASNIGKDNWRKFEKTLDAEIRRDKNGLLLDNLEPHWYEYVVPILYINRLGDEAVQDFMKTVRALINTDYEIRTPRPAMGWKGPARQQEDPFIESLINRKIIIVDQTQWLFTHSGMRVPTDELRTNVFQKEIIKRIKEASGFGTY
jgi:hypothetical protein